jgi:hypothetical protein
VDDALFAGGDVEKGNTKIRTVFPELLDHGVGQTVFEGLDPLIGWNDVIDGGKGAVWKSDLQPKISYHSKRLGAGDLVNEVGADKKLGRSVGKFCDGVTIPNFMKKGLTHKLLQ